MRRILITGAGGFIGSHMVDACKERGDHVTALDRKGLSWESSAFPWIQSIAKPDRVICETLNYGITAKTEFDVCFHLAAAAGIPPSYDRPVNYVRSNVEGVACVLEAARNCRGKVVYAGSSTAADPTLNVYAATKFCGEKLCETWMNAFDVHVDIARFFNVFGPREYREGDAATVLGIFTKQYYAGEKLTVTGDGSQRRAFIHVADVVDGLLAIADKGDGDASVYELGSLQSWSINQLVRAFVDDARIEYIDRPPGEMQVTECVSSRAKGLGWEPARGVFGWIEEIKNARRPVAS